MITNKSEKTRVKRPEQKFYQGIVFQMINTFTDLQFQLSQSFVLDQFSVHDFFVFVIFGFNYSNFVQK
ncbi:hypothetical protein pb186bvf_012420 [Paramecium bursaria]